MNSFPESLKEDQVASILDDLVEELIQRRQAGLPIDIDDYLSKRPELASQVRNLLPSLRMLADLSETGNENSLSKFRSHVMADVVEGVFGDFEILREIGRGGMGVVYEARQVSLGRQVAVKVLPFASVLDQRQLQRFKNEAMAAAQLDHPNIVRVHGTGCERGVHFYAMQYIEGRSLAEMIAHLQTDGNEPAAETPIPRSWISDDSFQFAVPEIEEQGVIQNSQLQSRGASDREVPHSEFASDTGPLAQLSTEQFCSSTDYFRGVADLGIQIAEALEYAHSVGIVHRDIKPSNLLLDERGKVWVTDFGLAQIESSHNLTLTGDVLGTLRYMSPEQSSGKRGFIDHRSDLYSLGITLYELLTLQPAFPNANRAELLQQVAECEPVRPGRINSSIPAELETIVLKVIEKEPDDRYGSARELADDLKRYLDDKPILARRTGLLQRAAKWSRRHRRLLLISSMLSTMCAIGLAAATALIWNEKHNTALALDQSEQNYELALQKQREIEAVLDFLVRDMLTFAAPQRALGRDVTVREALGKAERKIDKSFADHPAIEATVRNTLGTIYYTLGDYDSAESHLSRSRALRERHLGEEHPDTLVTRHVLGAVFYKQGRLKEAAQLNRQTLSARSRVLGEEHPRTLESMNDLAAVLATQGKLKEAHVLYEKNLKLQKRVLGPEHRDTLLSLVNVANSRRSLGKFREAAELFENALAAQRRVLGPENPYTLKTMSRLGMTLRALNRNSEALQLCRDVVQRQRKILGGNHPDTLYSEFVLAGIYRSQGQLAEASELYQRLLTERRRLLGSEHPDTLAVMTNFAPVLQSQGKLDEARKMLEEAFSVQKRTLGSGHADTLGTLTNLGAVCRMQGDIDRALECHRQAYDGFLRVYGKEHPSTLAVMNNLANMLSQKGELEKARELTEKAFEMLKRILGEEHPQTLMTAYNLAFRYASLEMFEEERKLRMQTLQIRRRVLGERHPDTLRSMYKLARVQKRLGNESEARKLWSEYHRAKTEAEKSTDRSVE